MRRDWKGIITLGATFLATIALGFVLLPQEAPQYWFHAVSDPSRVGDINFVDNISIQGWLMHYGLSGTAAKLGFYLLAALSVVLTPRFSISSNAATRFSPRCGDRVPDGQPLADQLVAS